MGNSVRITVTLKPLKGGVIRTYYLFKKKYWYSRISEIAYLSWFLHDPDYSITAILEEFEFDTDEIESQGYCFKGVPIDVPAAISKYTSYAVAKFSREHPMKI